MLTMVLWAVGNMMTVSSLESSQGVILAIIKDTSVLDCVIHFVTRAEYLELEVLEQIAFLVYQASRVQAWSDRQIDKLKYLANICLLQDTGPSCIRALSAVENLANLNPESIEILCDNTNFIKICVAGLQNS